MIVFKSMDPDWLSNTWLVADRPGGEGVLIDAGAPIEPILQQVRDLALTVRHALLTHHHVDHTAYTRELRAELGLTTYAHVDEAELFGSGLDHEVSDGFALEAGELRVRAIHIPGHTRGQLAFVVNEERVFTGDTLFKGSVGGTRGPGHGTFAELRRSIMEVLFALPHELEVHPGHTDPTTLAAEWEHNPFVRAWRGEPLAPLTDAPCQVAGEPARLLLEAPDYDGGTKCWIRFEDGREDVVGGSRLQRR